MDSQEECTIFLHAPFVMVTLSELVIIMMVTQRIYAIYLRSRYILAFLVILGGVHICLDVIAATSVIPLLPTALPLGCLITIKKDSYPLFAVLWGWNVIFDFSILILTLLRTLKLRNENSFSLFDLLCRDGIIYFVVMFSAKLMNFILFTRISINLITVNWAFNHIITYLKTTRASAYEILFFLRVFCLYDMEEVWV
ncbi:hypothetical protein PNOK_0714600 [Pyrrhoderma noxium]|uniref:Uncharacterized protein n=1 Tax=Pyrrhoderma noxium TaxID=2282107 RepID=A0A286UBV6_9AGAM|nr:hypothetical protein PNOK_0714600 [Pyrrhoderma noxium]